MEKLGEKHSHPHAWGSKERRTVLQTWAICFCEESSKMSLSQLEGKLDASVELSHEGLNGVYQE